MGMRRIKAGFGAALIGSALGGVLWSVTGYAGHAESVVQTVLGAAAIAVYGFLISLPFTFLYGVPIVSAGRRLGGVSVMLGAILGALPGAAWVMWTHDAFMHPVIWNGALIGGLYVRLSRPERHP